MIDNVQWDVDDPNTLRADIRAGQDGRSVFFRVNQRSEENPSADRIETSEVAQIVFEGGNNGGNGNDGTGGTGGGSAAPKVKSSRTYTKWKFRPAAEAGDGPAIVAGGVLRTST